MFTIIMLRKNSIEHYFMQTFHIYTYIYIYIYIYMSFNWEDIAQSVGVVEYADCISTEA